MSASQKGKSRIITEGQKLPYLIEFVRFATAFAVIIAVALLTLHIASAALQ